MCMGNKCLVLTGEVSESSPNSVLNRKLREPEHNMGVQYTCFMDHHTFVNMRVLLTLHHK